MIYKLVAPAGARSIYYLYMQTAKKPLLFLAAFYLGSLFILWPGVISPDAMNQYQAALAGVYSDHHPPAMSLLWHYLNLLYAGPGLLFALHLTLLYSAAAIFIYIFRTSKFKWWYVVFPLIPNMLAYTVFIVKDASFVYTYLLAGAIISLLIVQRQSKFKIPLLALCLLLLFYGTAAKFQARYLLIFFTLGIGYCYDYKFALKNIMVGIALCAALLGAMFAFNSYMVPNAQQQHTWQWVKLYDLSGISLELDKPMYPEFIKHNPNFDFARIKQQFDPQKVDDLVFGSDAPLRGGDNAIDRDTLWHYWFNTLKQHPWLYLKVRFKVWSYNLTSVPSEYNNPTKFLARTALKPIVEIPFMQACIDGAYQFINGALRFIWLVPFLIFYTYLGIKHFKRNSYAVPLTMFCVTSIALLLILFFFSMAGVARYVLLCTCLVHAAHGFAYRARTSARGVHATF